MPTYLAYGNSLQPFGNSLQPFDLMAMPAHLQHKHLQHFPENASERVKQRFRCRRLAYFLLWQLLKQSQKTEAEITALLTQIERSPSGRPYFANTTHNIDFNISHSGDWVAVVLHSNDNPHQSAPSVVGIDIEVAKKRAYRNILEHFAPVSEVNWLQTQENQEQAFYLCWCLREAVLKSQGVGIVKLSEVQHLAEQKQIFTHYSPTGTLYFTAELPFYLAVFINESTPQLNCFRWKNNQLCTQSLEPFIRYQVNK